MKYFIDTNIIIDFLHFITAKYYNLKIISNDKDLEKLEKNYNKFEKR